MKTHLATLLLIALPAGAAHAQPEFGGFLSIDKRFAVGGDSVIVADFYNRFRSEVTMPIGERLYVAASVDARFYELPRVDSFADLEDSERLFPIELSMWEAFVDVYGFLLDDFDLRIGKQRIAWGRADRLNPTDNLNPDDFSDLSEFGAKLPSWAINGTYYLGSSRLSAIWQPSPTPILLPKGGTALFLDAGSNTSNRLTRVAIPKGSSAALRFDGTAGSVDYSLSYLFGYDDIPVPRRVATGASSTTTTFTLPRMNVFGADMATEVWGAGLWAEAALFVAEKTDVVVASDDESVPSRQEALSGHPYAKWTIGADYTFRGGLYANAQWMRGFFTEREDGLHDYLFAYFEADLVDDALRVKAGGAVELDGRSNTGFGAFPELTYVAIDNLELTFGGFLVGGENGTLLGSWNDIDQVFVRAKVHF